MILPLNSNSELNLPVIKLYANFLKISGINNIFGKFELNHNSPFPYYAWSQSICTHTVNPQVSIEIP